MGSSEAAHNSAKIGSGILGTVQYCKSSREHFLADQRKALECQALHPTPIGDDVIDAAAGRSITSSSNTANYY